METEQQIYIFGNNNRGSEVIKELEKLGGINKNDYKGNSSHSIYFIDHNNEIATESKDTELAKVIIKYYNEIKLGPIKKKYDFKPYDKILVRDSDDEVWGCDFFSHYEDDSTQEIIGTSSVRWLICIPYNEKTAHLAGTNKDL